METKSNKQEKKRLLMLTDGNSDQASARIRAIEYIPMLEDAGFEITFIPRIPRKQVNTFVKYIYFPFLKRLLRIKRYFALYFSTWDVIYVQRIFIHKSALQKVVRKSRLIFDFDDAIFIDNRNNSAALKTADMVKFADETIVSTDWLNDFCSRHGKTATVIPTPVETDIIKPNEKTENKTLVIGWIGSAWTTGYLEPIIPALQQLATDYEFKFLTVGAKTGFTVQGINHTNMPWEPGIEPKALTQIDIGIMPLPDDDYARAKGGYKLYLYMAAGLPCIASPVGINSTIIKENINGLLAGTESQWYIALKTLLDKPELRYIMGESGRKQAVEEYDRKVCFAQLIRIINKQ